MPSIALLNGYALGGALELALACTFRLATPNAMMGFPEIKLGVCTGWGGTQRLPRLIGEQHALDLLLSGRFVDSCEALEMGLIASITDGDPRDSALEFASRFSANSLVAMRYVREAVSRSTDLPLDDGLRAESDLSTLSYQSSDAAEGIEAFIAKRPPRFTDR
jgi:enoyl-CoA hydratase